MDVRDTKALEKRLDDLGNRLEKLSEYKELNERYSFFLKEISKVLTEQNKYLIIKLDDCYTEMLVKHDEYFYKTGYADGSGRGIFSDFCYKVKEFLKKFVGQDDKTS